MNETYWVVVKPDGFVCHRTISLWRSGAVKDFAKPYRSRDTRDENIGQWWLKQYRKGARCIKVRLVPVGDE